MYITYRPLIWKILKNPSKNVIIKNRREGLKEKMKEGPGFKEFIIAANLKKLYREGLKDWSEIQDNDTKQEIRKYLRQELEQIKRSKGNNEYLMATMRQKVNMVKAMVKQTK